MSRILGIDPSLTSTGVAILDCGEPLSMRTIRIQSAPPKRAKGDKTPVSLAERYERLRAIGDELMPYVVDSTTLAVVEGPSYASAGSGTWDRAGVWWHLVSRLQARRIPVAMVPPTVRAKWATGSGAAGKSPVAVGLSRLWPALPENLSDDEWDSAALATIGGQHLGWLPVELARHREQLAKVAWPELVSA